MKKRWPSIVLGLVVSIAALAYLFRRDMSGVGDELQHARYWVAVPCLMLSAGGLWLRSLRWRVLLDYRLAPDHSFHILNISYFINAVLPFRVGELVRAILAARVDPPVRVLTSLSSILVERVLDTLAVFALLGLTLAVLPVGVEIGLVGALLGLGAVIGGIVLVFFANHPGQAHRLLGLTGRVVPLLRRATVHEWLDHLLDGIAPLASVRSTLLLVWWTAISWAASVVAGYVALYTIFDDPTWGASMAMIALASFVIAVPAVPGNLGPFETAVAFSLAAAGLVNNASDAPSVAFAVLLHLFNLIVYIGLGLVGVWAESVSLGEVTRAAQALRAKIGPVPEPEVDG